MKCPRCGNNIEKDWEYCPKCGLRFRSRRNDLFENIFSRMRKEMQEMDKLFDKNFEVFDLSPFFRKPAQPRGSGFSIHITQRNREKPRIDVKTFGGIDREKVRKEVFEDLGIKKFQKKPDIQKPVPVKQAVKEEQTFPEPKTTEEPETHVNRIDSKVLVEIKLPGVKSLQDISVRDLEGSVEVRAMVGDKAFFKILTKPAQFRLVDRKFHKGLLHLEFS